MAVVLCHDGSLPVFWRVALVEVPWNKLSKELTGEKGGMEGRREGVGGKEGPGIM